MHSDIQNKKVVAAEIWPPVGLIELSWSPSSSIFSVSDFGQTYLTFQKSKFLHLSIASVGPSEIKLNNLCYVFAYLIVVLILESEYVYHINAKNINEWKKYTEKWTKIKS